MTSTDRQALLQELGRLHERFEQWALTAMVEPLIASPLTMQQLKVLVMVAVGQGGATSQSLAKRLKVSMATMSGIVDRLVDHDVVQRTDDPSDRRVRRLVVTPAGSELATRLLSGPDIMPEAVLERMDQQGLRALIEALAALERAWSDLVTEPRSTGRSPGPEPQSEAGTVEPRRRGAEAG